MTERLRQVVAQVEQRSPEVQDALADILEQDIEERAWDAIVRKPGSQRFLEQLALEARREDAANETRDLDELL